MQDDPPEPTAGALLKRIFQLESQTASLTEQVAKANAEFNRAANLFADFDKMLMHHCMKHDDEFKDAWARIKSLEFTVFPNLAQDVVDIHKIIGEGEPWKANQLDSRTKLPWKDDKKPPN